MQVRIFGMGLVTLVTALTLTLAPALASAQSMPIPTLDALQVTASPPTANTLDVVTVRGSRPPSNESIHGMFSYRPFLQDQLPQPVYSMPDQRPYIPASNAHGAAEGGDGCSGNPVIMSTGNKIEVSHLFETPGEMGLYARLAWNWRSAQRGIFGQNFLTNFDKKLIFQFTDGTRCVPAPGSSCQYSGKTLKLAFALRPDGAVREVFTASGHNNPNAMYKLDGSFSSGWTLRADGESIEHYSGVGFITRRLIPRASTGLTRTIRPAHIFRM